MRNLKIIIVVTVLYFNWKTWENNVYKIKETTSGAEKAIKKDDSFNPPKDKRTRFTKSCKSSRSNYMKVYMY